MAELATKCKDHFPAFIASLPMNNPDAMLDEAQRAIKDLGARGVQICSNVNGRPLDEPEFLPLFELMGELDFPVWMHPTRSPDFADYSTETRSKYDLWWAFGWPYETSVAMGRLALSGVFDRVPNLKIITHHMGAMIPYFEGRIGGGLDQLGRRTDDPHDVGTLDRLEKRPYDYFRMFYADTALFGALAATECGLASSSGPSTSSSGRTCPSTPRRVPASSERPSGSSTTSRPLSRTSSGSTRATPGGFSSSRGVRSYPLRRVSNHPPGPLPFGRLRTGLSRKRAVFYLRDTLRLLALRQRSGQAPGAPPLCTPLLQQPVRPR
jgi:hypothetical protein